MNQNIFSTILAACALSLLFSVGLSAQEIVREKEINRLFGSGNANLWEKKYPQAIADFQAILKLDPTVRNARFNLAEAYVKSGDLERGIAEIKNFIENGEDDLSDAFALISEVYLRNGETDRAIEFLSAKIAENPFAGYYEIRAEGFLKKNLIDEAIKDYAVAISKANHPGYLIRRARLYARKGEINSAVKDYLQFLDTFPDYEKARTEVIKLGAAETDLPVRLQPKTDTPTVAIVRLFQEGFDRLVEGDKNTGLYFLQKVAIADPKFAASHYYRGIIYDSQVLYAEAIEEFKKAYAISPNFIEPRLKHADRVRSNGYFEIALPMYKKILEINPMDARAFAGRGAAIVEQSKIFEQEFVAENIILRKKAVEEFNRAVALNPNIADAYIMRGDMLAEAGRLIEAAADYTRALAASRSEFTTGLILSLRAGVYCALGETEKAAADAARDPEIFSLKACREWAINQPEKPETAEDWIKRGLQITEDKNYLAAADAFGESLKIKESSEALAVRGKAYLLLENYAAANIDLSKAIALNPSNEEAYKLRAVLNELLNKNLEAVSDYGALINLKPDNSLYYANRAALLAKTEQPAAAIADYVKAIAESNYGSEFRIRRGDLYLKQKKYLSAIEDYSVAIEEMPLRISLYPKRAAALCAAGKKAAARADWQTYKKHGGQTIEVCQ